MAKKKLPALRELAERYRVERPGKFRLSACEPADSAGFGSKEEAARALEVGVERLAALQEKLYAQNQWALLVVFQAMDAAGKDSAIKHVMSGVNPQGCQVHSFKAPSAEELNHDFLWRCVARLPERGRIGIFNRSYYEEVLVVRVHEAILRSQRLPEKLIGKRLWAERFESIAALERHLARNGTAIVKFFLHLSREEQAKRFDERLADPEKHWKFSLGDLKERQHWQAYQKAYEEAIRATAAPHAPWYVVPADRKWFTRLVVVDALIDALERLEVDYPRVTDAQRAELLEGRRLLASERPRPRR